MKKNRASNIELLRIASMFLIMLMHATLAIGYPESPEFTNIEYFGISTAKAFSICAVNVFVMISGWFGIKYTNKGLFKLFFQVLFFSIIGYVTSIAFKVQAFSAHGLVSEGLMLGAKNYWFVQSYLVLFLLSPVLNTFIEHTSKEQQKKIYCCLGTRANHRSMDFPYIGLRVQERTFVFRVYWLIHFCTTPKNSQTRVDSMQDE